MSNNLKPTHNHTHTNKPKKTKYRYVKGVGGSAADTMRVQVGALPRVEMLDGAHVFTGVRALFCCAGGLDISLYSAGIVCADLLARRGFALDLAGRRMGLARGGGSVDGGSSVDGGGGLEGWL